MQFVWLVPSVILGLVAGPTTGAWHMLALALLSLIIFSLAARSRRSRDVDLSKPIDIVDGLVYIGDSQLPRWQIFWKQEWHDALYRKLKPELQTRRTIARLTEAHQWLEQTPGGFTVGATESGEPVTLKLDGAEAHLLVIGATGSGKSILLKQLVSGALASPEALEGRFRFWLLDFKGGAAFAGYSTSPAVERYVTDIDDHDPVELWKQVGAELSRRETALARGAAIEDQLFIVIDELAEVFLRSPNAQPALSSLLARGRSLGMHLIAASQALTGVSQAMLANFGVRILLGRADPVTQSQLGFRSAADRLELPSGWLSGQLNFSSNVSTRFIFSAAPLL